MKVLSSLALGHLKPWVVWVTGFGTGWWLKIMPEPHHILFCLVDFKLLVKTLFSLLNFTTWSVRLSGAISSNVWGGQERSIRTGYMCSTVRQSCTQSNPVSLFTNTEWQYSCSLPSCHGLPHTKHIVIIEEPVCAAEAICCPTENSHHLKS